MNIRKALEVAKKQIIKKVDNALTNEVFQEIKKEEQGTIISEVYDVYEPKQYYRREEEGGLGDAENIEIEGGSANNGKLAVINTTKANPDGCRDDGVTVGKNLPELVEYGYGYKNYRYDFPSKRAKFMKPRPFTKKTVVHLKASKAHISALKKGLKRQGVKIK